MAATVTCRNKKREYIAQIKKNGCLQCGSTRNLQFHHLDPKKKKFRIGSSISSGYSFQRLKKEVDKCIVLCSDCHKEIHDVL